MIRSCGPGWTQSMLTSVMSGSGWGANFCMTRTPTLPQSRAVELQPCRECDKPVYSYQTTALFPGDDGEYEVHTQWVHLHPAEDGHKPNPVRIEEEERP